MTPVNQNLGQYITFGHLELIIVDSTSLLVNWNSELRIVDNISLVVTWNSESSTIRDKPRSARSRQVPGNFG